MELTLQDTGKQFPGGTEALKNVNLSVSQGEFVSVIGRPVPEKLRCFAS